MRFQNHLETTSRIFTKIAKKQLHSDGWMDATVVISPFSSTTAEIEHGGEAVPFNTLIPLYCGDDVYEFRCPRDMAIQKHLRRKQGRGFRIQVRLTASTERAIIHSTGRLAKWDQELFELETDVEPFGGLSVKCEFDAAHFMTKVFLVYREAALGQELELIRQHAITTRVMHLADCVKAARGFDLSAGALFSAEHQNVLDEVVAPKRTCRRLNFDVEITSAAQQPPPPRDADAIAAAPQQQQQQQKQDAVVGVDENTEK